MKLISIINKKNKLNKNHSQSLSDAQLVALREVCEIPVLSWNLKTSVMSIEDKISILDSLCDLGIIQVFIVCPDNDRLGYIYTRNSVSEQILDFIDNGPKKANLSK